MLHAAMCCFQTGGGGRRFGGCGGYSGCAGVQELQVLVRVWVSVKAAELAMVLALVVLDVARLVPVVVVVVHGPEPWQGSCNARGPQ